MRPEPRLGLADKAFSRFDARLPRDGHPAATGLPQVVDEAKEDEGRRLLSLLPALLQQAPVETQHGCLLGGDSQFKSREPLFHFLSKLLRIRAVLEHRYVVIRKPGQLGEALAGLPEPSFDPQ